MGLAGSIYVAAGLPVARAVYREGGLLVAFGGFSGELVLGTMGGKG